MLIFSNIQRVYARDRPWEADQPTTASPHWWAHQAGLSTVGWECIADENCRPSWDKPFEVTCNILSWVIMFYQTIDRLNSISH
jgi:hypothetical protein